MNMKRIFPLILVVTMTFSGCSFYTYYHPTGSTSFAETNPDSIVLLAGDSDREYDVIASVAVDVAGGTIAASDYLKRKAAELGADAVIKIELKKLSTYTSRIGVSGIAIKYK